MRGQSFDQVHLDHTSVGRLHELRGEHLVLWPVLYRGAAVAALRGVRAFDLELRAVLLVLASRIAAAERAPNFLIR